MSDARPWRRTLHDAGREAHTTSLGRSTVVDRSAFALPKTDAP